MSIKDLSLIYGDVHPVVFRTNVQTDWFRKILIEWI